MVGYQVNAWQPAEFMNLAITPCGKPMPTLAATATASSFQPGYEPSNAVDGDPSTMWHTAFSPVKAALPQSITLDLGGVYQLYRLKYLPRQDGQGNGTITRYNIYASTDGVSFGAPIESGSWQDSSASKTAPLHGVHARYVRLKGVEGVGGFCSAAEIAVSGNKAKP
jgi:endo-alpha-N-acetylgalactosaminidase